ncbi:DinB family protein [Arsenicicoccus sp. oral taxon 190]|uniref:DinB family protein n=1 Tax=Arsenicicoccus sp. oral taxon 190 TaxID=1658671 RepID=UPI00067A3A78|nr:DinB family protein [Arsenicicoccus sp. oral taxon 190]AKT52081.1 hypothetical protein ADJ73_13765 [Arsenicicoccus sp. oral taxon 190]
MPTHHVVPERADERVDPPKLADERESLDSWLELYRETVLHKVAGLDGEQLARRSVPPSSLSLLGVIRHLTEVEEYWLGVVLLGDDVPDRYCTPDRPEADFEDGTAASAEGDVAAYVAQLEVSRSAQASWSDLDGPVRGLRRGEQVNLRWILVHLIEEYARHLGHMDLLREAIDGRTGY